MRCCPRLRIGNRDFPGNIFSNDEREMDLEQTIKSWC